MLNREAFYSVLAWLWFKREVQKKKRASHQWNPVPRWLSGIGFYRLFLLDLELGLDLVGLFVTVRCSVSD